MKNIEYAIVEFFNEKKGFGKAVGNRGQRVHIHRASCRYFFVRHGVLAEDFGDWTPSIGDHIVVSRSKSNPKIADRWTSAVGWHDAQNRLVEVTKKLALLTHFPIATETVQPVCVTLAPQAPLTASPARTVIGKGGRPRLVCTA